MKSNRSKDRQRTLLAQEAARIMEGEGLADFRLAKRKAAQRLGLPPNGKLPKNSEVEEALKDYQRLFGGPARQQTIRRLRSTALEAMGFLARFSPRLVGPVLEGTANAHSGPNLHLFADAAEDVMMFLMERQIPYETIERRYRLNAVEAAYFPVYRFHAGEVPVELTVFPPAVLRQPPLSPVDGKPMRRASTLELSELLEVPETDPTAGSG